MKEKILAALKSAFTEVNGKASASRLLGASVVLSSIIWVTYIVLKTTQLPDLTGAALYVGAGFSGYGMNRIANSMRGDDK